MLKERNINSRNKQQANVSFKRCQMGVRYLLFPYLSFVIRKAGNLWVYYVRTYRSAEAVRQQTLRPSFG